MRIAGLFVLIAISPASAQEVGLSVAHTRTSENRIFSPTGFDAFISVGGILSLRAGISRAGATANVADSFCRGGPQPPDADCTDQPSRSSVTLTVRTLEGVLRHRIGQRARIDFSVGYGIAVASARTVRESDALEIRDEGTGRGPTVGLMASYALFDRLPLRAMLGVRYMELKSGCAVDGSGFFNCRSGTLRKVTGGLVLDLRAL